MTTLTIELRSPGRPSASRSPLQVPYPATLMQTYGATTVRQLIIALVAEEVSAFQHRQSEQRLLPFMTAAAIANSAARGKITPKPDTPSGTVDLTLAANNALQAFQDGLFYLFVNGEQQEDLDCVVTITPDSRLTLLRLVALAGG